MSRGGRTAEDDVLCGGGAVEAADCSGQTVAIAERGFRFLCYTVATTTTTLLHAACIAVDGRPTREACVLLVCVDLAAAAREVEQKGSRYRLLAA